MKVNCDLCNRKELEEYFDAATKMGPWGNLCPTCFKSFGLGLGTVREQQYRWNGDLGHYTKIAG